MLESVQLSRWVVEPGGTPGVAKISLIAQRELNTGEVLRELCKFNLREHERKYDQLDGVESSKIWELTGCIKPCRYKKYTFSGERSSTAFKGSEDFVFSLWAVSEKTQVKTEQLIYPLAYLVAEFGGILGLFLGFSFISLWDHILLLKYGCKIVKIFQN